MDTSDNLLKQNDKAGKVLMRGTSYSLLDMFTTGRPYFLCVMARGRLLYPQGGQAMHRCICIAAILGIVSGLTSFPAQAQKADDPKKVPLKKGTVFFTPSTPSGVDVIKKGDKADPKVAKDKLVATGFIPGKLLKLDGSELKVQYTWRYAEINQERYANYLAVYNEWVAAIASATIDEDGNYVGADLADIYNRGVAASQNLWDIKEALVDYRLDFNDQLKVRLAKLPPVFDADGKRRGYTAKELQELKGNSTLPGYAAKLDDLKLSQTVRVYFVKKKNPANNPLVLRTEPYLLEATAIVILEEPAAPSPDQ
jgi:hypothetical protein